MVDENWGVYSKKTYYVDPNNQVGRFNNDSHGSCTLAI